MTTEKHMVRGLIDKKLLKNMADAGEIRITENGRVFGLEDYLKRTFRRRR